MSVNYQKLMRRVPPSTFKRRHKLLTNLKRIYETVIKSGFDEIQNDDIYIKFVDHKELLKLISNEY
jgi:hypothetical protein